MEYFSLCLKIIEDEKKKFNLDSEEVTISITEFVGAEAFYESPYDRCAFMFKYATITVIFMKDCTKKFLLEYPEIKTLLQNWKDNSDLKFCSLSCGPALDYLALNLALSEFVDLDLHPFFKSLNILSKSGQWKNTWNIMTDNLKLGYLKNFPISVLSESCKVIQCALLSEKFSEKQKVAIQNADVLFMMKTLNFSKPDDSGESGLHFQEFVAAMKTGSCLFCLDTKPSVEIMMEVITKMPGKFIYGPSHCTYQHPEKFPEAFKQIYGSLPVITARGVFFVWQKSNIGSILTTPNSILSGEESSNKRESTDSIINFSPFKTNEPSLTSLIKNGHFNFGIKTENVDFPGSKNHVNASYFTTASPVLVGGESLLKNEDQDFIASSSFDNIWNSNLALLPGHENFKSIFNSKCVSSISKTNLDKEHEDSVNFFKNLSSTPEQPLNDVKQNKVNEPVINALECNKENDVLINEPFAPKWNTNFFSLKENSDHNNQYDAAFSALATKNPFEKKNKIKDTCDIVVNNQVISHKSQDNQYETTFSALATPFEKENGIKDACDIVNNQMNEKIFPVVSNSSVNTETKFITCIPPPEIPSKWLKSSDCDKQVSSDLIEGAKDDFSSKPSVIPCNWLKTSELDKQLSTDLIEGAKGDFYSKSSVIPSKWLKSCDCDKQISSDLIEGAKDDFSSKSSVSSYSSTSQITFDFDTTCAKSTKRKQIRSERKMRLLDLTALINSHAHKTVDFSFPKQSKKSFIPKERSQIDLHKSSLSNKNISSKELTNRSSPCLGPLKSTEEKKTPTKIASNFECNPVTNSDSIEYLTNRIKKLVTSFEDATNKSDGRGSHDGIHCVHMHPAKMNGLRPNDDWLPQQSSFSHSNDVGCHSSNKACLKTNDNTELKSEISMMETHSNQIPCRECSHACHGCMCKCQRMQSYSPCFHGNSCFSCNHHGFSNCVRQNFVSCQTCCAHNFERETSQMTPNIVIPLQNVSSDTLAQIIAILKGSESTTSK